MTVSWWWLVRWLQAALTHVQHDRVVIDAVGAADGVVKPVRAFEIGRRRVGDDGAWDRHAKACLRLALANKPDRGHAGPNSHRAVLRLRAQRYLRWWVGSAGVAIPRTVVTDCCLCPAARTRGRVSSIGTTVAQLKARKRRQREPEELDEASGSLRSCTEKRFRHQRLDGLEPAARALMCARLPSSWIAWHAAW